MSDNNDKLKTLNDSFASMEKAITELQGCMGDNGHSKTPSEDMNSRLNSVISSMFGSMAALRNHMHDLHNSHAKRMDEHMSEAHVPALKTATHMQNFLKACGMDNDVEVVKPKIYASYATKVTANKRGLTLEIDYTKPTGRK